MPGCKTDNAINCCFLTLTYTRDGEMTDKDRGQQNQSSVYRGVKPAAIGFMKEEEFKVITNVMH